MIKKRMKHILVLLTTVFVCCLTAANAQTLRPPAETPKPEIAWRHKYHQTLMMKLFLSEVEAVPGEGIQIKVRDGGESKVVVTFEQALEIIRKVDHLTLGIPKIVYLVGWQYNGHDSKYPAWGEVNPKLKRPQDATALESMQWLMAEAFKYNTAVSVHINMFDAYDDSPLWDTYVANDIIARNADGSLRRGEWGWPVCYTQEWNTGYAQKRIDGLCEMLPLAKAGTVHIDAFHTWPPYTPDGSPISPDLGFTAEQETETQRKIFLYWASKGIDVTSEGMRFLRLSAFEGLQPAAWWYSPSVEEYMAWPASYYCGGTTNDAEGRLFGKSMHGEDIFRKDPHELSGFLRQFCTQTLPWYYLNRLQRQEYIRQSSFREVHFSDGIITRLEGEAYTIRQNGRLMLHNGDVFMPALWMDKPAIIAYSTDGYREKTWELPAGWNAEKVDIYRISMNGTQLLHSRVALKKRQLKLSLGKDEAVLIYLIPPTEQH
ncbi:MAG: endo-alpha-N-acetylgalactosaminidase family protein [Tannerella sp.]|nr:endo-alpha-N-acetylgalactosaminidase family protein [Tannerella sp.]